MVVNMKLTKQKMNLQRDNRHWSSVSAYTVCDMLNHDKLAFNKMEVMK